MSDIVNLPLAESSLPIKNKRLTDNYSIVPNSFAQTTKLCPTSIAVALYLHSLPMDWIPRPTQIQNHFGFSSCLWRKVSKELKAEGYLTLVKGGNTGGGSYLEFDIMASSRDVENLHLGGDFPRCRKSESREIYTHTKYNQSTKETVVLKTTTKRPETPTVKPKEKAPMNTQSDPVVVSLIEKMEALGVSNPWAKKFAATYSQDKIEKVLGMYEQKKDQVLSPPAWFKSALERNYTDTRALPKTNVQTVNHVQREKHIAESSLRSHNERIASYMKQSAGK